MFAFPLRRGQVKLGALTLTRSIAGDLDPRQYASALIFARLALDLVLSGDFTSSPDVHPEPVFQVGADTALIHQATGTVSVQLGVGLSEALSVLRAHAYTINESLSWLAAEIVARRVRLD